MPASRLPFMVWVLSLTQTNTEGGSKIRGHVNRYNHGSPESGPNFTDAPIRTERAAFYAIRSVNASM